MQQIDGILISISTETTAGKEIDDQNDTSDKLDDQNVTSKEIDYPDEANEVKEDLDYSSEEVEDLTDDSLTTMEGRENDDNDPLFPDY